MEQKHLNIDSDFRNWISTLKKDIRQAQIKAAVKVNSELLHLYWHLGEEIAHKQKLATWGDGWLKELSRELLAEFPDMKGFSLRNLQSIKKWYSFYNQTDTIAKQVVAQLGETFFAIPWGHHLYIISQCKEPQKAMFFLQKTLENGWSRSMLLNFLDTDLYERQGQALNNFTRLLPQPQSDLAQEMTKDPYKFDFLTLTEGYREKELKDALEVNIRNFLLELGTGFAYMGREYRIVIGETEKFIDMLFYNLNLRCYVVVEIKTGKFESEYIGQLGTYVAAVNHLLKKDIDNPTLGLLICKSKDNVLAQYALESSNQPIGVSEYELSKLYPTDFKGTLPSIEEIENELK